MQASLLEMVLAITIAGLIFAAAIIPMTQTMVAYQEAEANVRTATWQATATVRAEQVAASIWCDADPPQDHDTLTTATSSSMAVGDWELRQTANYFEQKLGLTGWSRIAEPVQNFAFQYLLNDGSWAASATASELEDVLAVRFDWSDSDTGRTYGGLIVTPDHTFAAGLIELPQPDTSEPYSRDDYERTITFSLGSWQ